VDIRLRLLCVVTKVFSFLDAALHKQTSTTDLLMNFTNIKHPFIQLESGDSIIHVAEGGSNLIGSINQGSELHLISPSAFLKMFETAE
jgi:hypothetical protein